MSQEEESGFESEVPSTSARESQPQTPVSLLQEVGSLASSALSAARTLFIEEEAVDFLIGNRQPIPTQQQSTTED